MSLLIKTVIPFAWSTAPNIKFQQGTASSVNLAASVNNPDGVPIVYRYVIRGSRVHGGKNLHIDLLAPVNR